MVSFYVDTCIWLNLFKKEGDSSKGKPYWEIAREFFNKLDKQDIILYYSKCVLKELRFQLSTEDYIGKKRLFEITPNYYESTIEEKDLILARKIESEQGYEISFYDVIHMVLSMKQDAVLITRDKKLLEVCKKYPIKATRPENYL